MSRRGQRGSAMTSTMVFLVIALLALMQSFQRLHEVLQIEEAGLRVPSDSDGTAEALGRAIARMHTGVPSESPYTCRSRLRSSDGDDVLAFRITHTQVSDDHWLVTAAASAGEDPDCPASFEQACPLGAP
jgi:hypothetical protein